VGQYNCAEAVNFATLDWLEYGHKCVQRYRQFRKQPCFSHDELLYNVARADKAINTALWYGGAPPAPSEAACYAVEVLRLTHVSCLRCWKAPVHRLKDPLARMVDEEMTYRQRLQAYGVETEEVDNRDETQCHICQYDVHSAHPARGARHGPLTRYHLPRLLRRASALCFLSYVATGEGDACYCPQHGLALANMQHARDLVLRVRVSQDELRRLVDDVRRRADKPREWSRRLRDQLRQTPRPPLRAMQLMLQEADKIPVPIPEVAPLRAMVDKAAAWADKILKILARRQRKRPARGGSGDAANKDGAADGAGAAGEGKATLAEVEALLEEADAIPFEVPEVAELRLVVKGVAAFQERARRFLATATAKDYTLDELTEVLHQGRSLEVEVDEVAELNRLIQRIQWSEKGAGARAGGGQ